MERRDLARRSLIAATHRLLESRPWPEITIDDITHDAGMSRTAFYQHFTDRQDLLLTLFATLADNLARVADAWMTGGDDPAAEHRRSLAGLTELYLTHGRLLQAVFDAAVSEPDVAHAYEHLAAGIVAATADGIRRDMANGHTEVDDPDEMSRALSALMERYLLRSFGREPFPDPAAVTDTLATIWTRTLYPHPPEAGAAAWSEAARTR
ncbi:transcriptional regulator, TetR family [Jatrophihabitans endophyticus]|uniref:Transcriptional regulator, TetR family n=2 Tax=Jatrophihabitans endophyticus TaxID=1206085 RepID=A0A1M5K2Z0_9ACTN|nr:transcriptional regulator, TetR family [Jatrophihabitans endophyticus]